MAYDFISERKLASYRKRRRRRRKRKEKKGNPVPGQSSMDPYPTSSIYMIPPRACRSAGLIIGLEPAVGSMKDLLPAALFFVSSCHRRMGTRR